MKKQCRRCLKVKVLNSFYDHPETADGKFAKCKDCVLVERRKTTKPDDKKAWNERWILKNVIQPEACAIVGRAIRNGKLKKQPCEVCGEIKVEAHHDDYSKPLNVRWLCKYHHTQHHLEMRRLERLTLDLLDLDHPKSNPHELTEEAAVARLARLATPSAAFVKNAERTHGARKGGL